MYDDVGASGVGKGLLTGGALGGGALGGGGILPETGIAVLEIVSIALVALCVGVGLLRIAAKRKASAPVE